mmetsp:Transcript_5062/g.4290  ORF Transcript_5062/g.4290 Transcript_5062/m.4290 type:complete len:153 (+) Transcript_5062:23-481(+)
MMIGLSEVQKLNEKQKQENFVKVSHNRIKNEKDYDFLACSYGHICGLRVKFKYYFTKDSPILFKFPMGETKEWSNALRANNFAEAYQMEDDAVRNINWRNASRDDLMCTICNIQFGRTDELVDHCERDRSHYTCIEKFLLNDPDPEKLDPRY